MERTIPCTDCAEKSLDVRQLGFQVTGCSPHPTRTGFCILTFEEAGTARAVIDAGGAAESIDRLESQKILTFSASGGVTDTQAATAKAIVNLFETGEVLGQYGNVTLIPGDAGHLTFGRSQATLGSGNLAELLQSYCSNPGARFAARLAPYLPRFFALDQTLDNDHKLHNILRASADDSVMRETQDAFFDKKFWQPALRATVKLGMLSPLATAVVYDGFVHGSWMMIRDRTTQSAGSPTAIGEQAWIRAYVASRRTWLETNTRTDLRSTVYRMDAFKRLIDQGFWGLGLPLVVLSKEISSLTLRAIPTGCYEGPQPGTRPITLQSPLLRGLDVRLVQLALSDRGVDIQADGIFGQTSEKIVKIWQTELGRPANGILDFSQVDELTT